MPFLGSNGVFCLNIPFRAVGRRIVPGVCVMKLFVVNIDLLKDVPFVLAKTLGNIHTLRATRNDWASLVRALGMDVGKRYAKAPLRTVHEAAQYIVDNAPFDPRDVKKRRAEMKSNDFAVKFVIEGRITVDLIAHQDSGKTPTMLTLRVESTTELRRLAVLMLADLYRRVPAAILQLEEAVVEAAAHYRSVGRG